ncbi:hypothetical protein [Mucilaginibacter sp.]|uniref:hypothetical protein n=1 Tax=Mucilaginibacter sp. TaxID=1882438 RepID=UPI00374CD57F
MKSKALLLLFIFLLNTIAGFSCALRMSHDEHQEAAEHHSHHHATTVFAHDQFIPGEITVSPNDPCCQGAVNNFISLAKLIPSSGHILLQAPFAYINSSFQCALAVLPGIKLARPIVIDERQRPPNNDIRITIQSLLI